MTKRRNHFQDLDLTQEDGHPIDISVSKRLVRKWPAYNKTVCALATKIAKALGAKNKLFVKYDDLKNDWIATRDEAYFNEGYEHGLAAGSAHALKLIRSTTGNELSTLLRQQLIRAGIPSHESAQVLLELAWEVLHKSDRTP